MNRRQFTVLFLCNFIPWWVGSGLVPLLPLHAASLGASPAVAGNHLAMIFLAMAIGTVVGGWLVSKMRGFRQLLIALGLISAVTTILLGYVTKVWQLILLNATGWFALGIIFALVIIFVGEWVEEGKRGRVFGILAMSTSLGGILGGVAGFIADQWGYPRLFVVAGALFLIQVIAACFLSNPPKVAPQPLKQDESGADAQASSMHFSVAFLLVLVAAAIYSAAGFAGLLGRSLVMEDRGFSNTTISLTAALVSVLGLVGNPLFGYLSDRSGRRWLLAACYLTGALGLALIVYSYSFSHFVLVSFFSAIGSADRGISTALASDLLPRHSLSRGLSLFDSAKWFGGVVGLSATGYVIDHMGLAQALFLGALLPLLSVLLLLFVQKKASVAQAATAVPEPT